MVGAVINEALRLYPPVHTLLTRHADTDTHLVGGFHVPAGTKVSLGIHGVNRHPSAWAKPHVFDPERFMGDKKPSSSRNFLSFSAGPRRCLGDRFSLLEQQVFLQKLLTRFELLPDAPGGGPAAQDEKVHRIARSAESMPLLFNQPLAVQVRVKRLAAHRNRLERQQ